MMDHRTNRTYRVGYQTRPKKAGFRVGILLALFTALCLVTFWFHDIRASSINLSGTVYKVPKDRSVAGQPDDGLWDGPILYHHPSDKPIHLILLEKSTQKLHIYRYDGHYRRIKTYFCATGERKGKKRAEKDERTPEGIYFNDRTFRDKKITVFGDRAFGLNYPDIFDNLAGNRGGGIFVHGSNRPVAPFSTNGCLVMNNDDIADLDRRVDMKQTPVIIGERLPYRFDVVKRDVSELIPFLKQAMLPEKYAGKSSEFSALTMIGFEDRVVATGRIRIQDAGTLTSGTSRLYMAGPGQQLLVLLKREWNEEKRETIVATKTVAVKKSSMKAASKRPPGDKRRVRHLVESWRKAWESKRLNDYIAHYHPAFSSKGKNLAGWKKYKARLNKKYRKISVSVSNVRVRMEGKKAKAYFRQRYRSDTFRSNSYKILEFLKKDRKWKIYRENSFAGKPANWPV